MKNLLFFAARALLLIESTVAFADPPSQNIMERADKWSGGERFPAQPQATASHGCHNVRVRIGTRNGHAVYKNQRICA
jgi:hypothetical protein